MNSTCDYILGALLNNWLNGSIINDFYLLETFVYIAKL